MNLREHYNRETFQTYLRKMISDFAPSLQKLTNLPEGFREGTILGRSDKLDIAILEIEIHSHLSSRITITRSAFKLMSTHGLFRALVVFKSSNEEQWRISLVTSTPQYKAGKIEVALSNPKRFSHVVGPKTPVKTAEKYLLNGGSFSSFPDLLSRFSIETVNNDFYSLIANLYDEFIKEQKKITSIEMHAATDFCIRLMGRIIFCWFLKEKKSNSGIPLLSNDLLSRSSLNSKDLYYQHIAPLFFEVLNKPEDERHERYKSGNFQQVPYVNGGLFAEQETDRQANGKSNAAILVTDRWINDFLEILESYNFTVDENSSADIELSIDPEILGRIFENLLARINPETADTVRKSSGSFYTPREIVDFMVERGLADFLHRSTGLDKAIVEAVVSYDLNDDRNHEVSEADRRAIIEKLLSIKVLDPACGSGAFPIGVLQRIMHIFRVLDPTAEIWVDLQTKNLPRELRKLFKRETEAKNFEYLQKHFVVRDSIYGSDIQPTAVEISRLRCFLTLIVDQEVRDEEPNRGIYPLPNLNFKFVSSNSLVALTSISELNFGEDEDLQQQLMELKGDFFETQSTLKRNKLKEKYGQLVNAEVSLFGESEKTRQLKTHKPFDPESVADFFDPTFMLGVASFDLIIGNPPYVSTKGVDSELKNVFEKQYGFSDDLYSHFFFKSFELLAPMGTVIFICSKTFWTIQTKKNLRDLLMEKGIILICDTSNPFQSALVDTCIVMSNNGEKAKNCEYIKIDQKSDSDPSIHFDQKIFSKAINNIFFAPTEQNMTIYSKLNDDAAKLMKQWWPYIRTSKTMSESENIIDRYLKGLKPGDIALLGTLVDGGQGLATGNNGRFVGVLETSKLARRIKELRVEKVSELLFEKKDKSLGSSVSEIVAKLDGFNEGKFVDLIDNIKLKYGRDALGKGFLYRIISESVIADVKKMTDKEKSNGISGESCFVPYDKGDKDGNSWYLPTPFYIDWSKDSVNELRTSKAAVIRNPQFYFKSGVCWILTLNEQSEYFKARLRDPGVFDVNAMSMFITNNLISEKYLVCLLNSYTIFLYKRSFINSTSAFQINDARQLPIVIPTSTQLAKFESLFDRAVEVKKAQYENALSNVELSDKLKEIQIELDEMVAILYRIPNFSKLSKIDDSRQP
jgi:type I restriction-modification system DNA methylase subunit